MAVTTHSNGMVNPSQQRPRVLMSKESESDDLQPLSQDTVQRGFYAPGTPSQLRSHARLSSDSGAVDLQPLSQDTVQRAFHAPGMLTPADVMALQRSVGNQAVQRMLRDRAQPPKPSVPIGAPQSGRQMIQPKLEVGPVGDKYELEADRVAKQVVNISAPVQRKDRKNSDVQREEVGGAEIMRKPLGQRAGQGGFEVDSDFEGSLKNSKGGGAPLPDNLRADFEPKFGADFGGVTVHTDAKADRLNRSIQAKAFTSGQDLYFRQGAYEPGRRQGQELIAHELTHVVQQNGAAVQTKRVATGLKGTLSTKEDQSSDRQRDGTGAYDVQMARDDYGRATAGQQTETAASPTPTFLKTPSSGGVAGTPIQRRFGFEIEMPILFTAKDDFDNVPAHGFPPPMGVMPTQNLADVPCDAEFETHRETDLYDIPTADAHVNVDHNGSLDGLFTRDLQQYGDDEGLTPDQTNGLKYGKGRMIPSRAPIMEVVTDAWDEHALNPVQARTKFEEVRDWVAARYNAIQGNHKVAMGNYFLGSDAPFSDHFQPRQGYFHATYGVKLHQVPQLFQQTTLQKDRLSTYAQTNPQQSKHADNVNRTFSSIGKAQTALTTIKGVWPRTGGGFSRGGYTKGTKGWTPAIEGAFLGFLTLLSNYLVMFQNGSTDNLGKNKVGMHYYKSDLYDLAQQLPVAIIGVLQNNAVVRRKVIKAIGSSVGLRRNSNLTGPMQGYTLETYLDQIFRGTLGPVGQDVNNADMHDPLLQGSINPWSAKLGPDQVGPATNRGLGVVMENRHLEYLDYNYGANTDQAENQGRQDTAQYGMLQHPVRSANDVAMDESNIVRQQGSAIRPINEWVPMMMNIYHMLHDLNA